MATQREAPGLWLSILLRQKYSKSVSSVGKRDQAGGRLNLSQLPHLNSQQMSEHNVKTLEIQFWTKFPQREPSGPRSPCLHLGKGPVTCGLLHLGRQKMLRPEASPGCYP